MLTFYRRTRAMLPSELLPAAIAHLDRATRKTALDIGCGAGRDSRYLVSEGFSVTAVDPEPWVAASLGDLFQCRQFRLINLPIESIELDSYGLVNASYSLPFCSAPSQFNLTMNHVLASLEPGGVFAGHLFGERDDWNASFADRMTFHDRAGIGEAFRGLWVALLREFEADAPDADGNAKHWHVFQVIAKKLP